MSKLVAELMSKLMVDDVKTRRQFEDLDADEREEILSDVCRHMRALVAERHAEAMRKAKKGKTRRHRRP